MNVMTGTITIRTLFFINMVLDWIYFKNVTVQSNKRQTKTKYKQQNMQFYMITWSYDIFVRLTESDF